MSTDTVGFEEASSEQMTTTATSRATDAAPRRRGYGALWASVPSEFAFLILAMPIAIIGLSVLASLFFTGLGMISWCSASSSSSPRSSSLAASAPSSSYASAGPAARRSRRPAWDARDRDQGFWRTMFAPFIDGHYWLYFLHGLVVNPIVSIVTWSITIAWISVAPRRHHHWIWQRFIPDEDRDVWLQRVACSTGCCRRGREHRPQVAEPILEFVVGLIFVATLPFVSRGLDLLHDVIARGMLGAFRSEALESEVAQLSRRVARPCGRGHRAPPPRARHPRRPAAAPRPDADGPRDHRAPARAGSGCGARAHRRGAQQSKEALDELRALSRGFAPPILLDRGLAAGARVARVRAPCRSSSRSTSRMPRSRAELERNAYFIAAEPLTNAAKHAARERIRLRRRAPAMPDAGRGSTSGSTDDGHGGAAATPGHGLAGLEERVRGLGGAARARQPGRRPDHDRRARAVRAARACGRSRAV